METTTIEERFTAAMKTVVERKGRDYVYPKSSADDDYHFNHACQYSTPNGTPACIIGCALAEIDPKLVPVYGQTMRAGSVLRHALGYGHGVEKLVWAANDAQRCQDDGGTWGKALDKYLESLEAWQ